MSTETAAPRRRIRVVVAVSVLVSLVCIGWWGVRLQWFAQEPDVSAHIVTFEPMVVTLADGAHARIAMAVVVLGEDAVAPVHAADELVRGAVVEEALRREAPTLRSGDGQDALRRDLLAAVRALVPDAAVDRVLLTEVLVT